MIEEATESSRDSVLQLSISMGASKSKVSCRFFFPGRWLLLVNDKLEGDLFYCNACRAYL